MRVLVGASGWQYRDWRGRFYPEHLPARLWLEFYAERFQTVEVNNTFYRLPERSVFEDWRGRVPPNFVMAAKASRFLTHIRRLRDPEEPVARFMEHAAPLGRRLGPVLLQLPPQMRINLDRLDATLAAFPPTVRVAVEPRHESWFTEDLRRLLRRRRAALCMADLRGPVTPVWRTTTWGYIRFHAGRGRPQPSYRRGELSEWLDRLAGEFKSADRLYAYFNNDTQACAPHDAVIFAEMCRERGWAVSRVPARHEVRAGASGASYVSAAASGATREPRRTDHRSAPLAAGPDGPRIAGPRRFRSGDRTPPRPS